MTDPEVACTLGASDVDVRLAEWRTVLGCVTGRERIPGGLRLRFPPTDGLAGELADLAQREHDCCAFFEFAVRVDAQGVALEVHAPPDAGEVVAALFGAAGD